MYRKILPPPGFVRDPTAYAAEGHWYDGDKVRFRYGFPETMGGWEKFASSSFQGIGRYLHDWVTQASTKYLGIGSTWKLFANQGANLYDITSLRLTLTLGSNPFATVNASGVVTVAHSDHDAVTGSYVTFSGSSAVNGIASVNFNKEHRINSVPTDNTYTILCAAAATSTASGGGSSVVADYQENVGLDTYIKGGTGWGVSAWGSGPWGGVREIDASGQLRTWSMDDFGDDLFATIRGGTTMYWDESDGTGARAKRVPDLARATISLAANPIATTNLSTTITVTDDGAHDLGVGDEVTLSGADATNGVPAGDINTVHTVTATPTETTYSVVVDTAATGTGSGGGSSVVAAYVAGEYYSPIDSLAVLVSDQERHAIVLGTNPIGSTKIDPLLVRWSTDNNISVWRPKLDNLAGGQRLSSGSHIMAGVKTKQEVVVWTDTSIHSMRYVGEPTVYSFSQLASDISIISPNAWAHTGDRTFFMARGGFYVYTGRLQELKCPVEGYVFSDLDVSQSYKVVCGTNNDYGEVMWHYPSLSDATSENSRYVIYNWRQDIWYFGTLARGFWTDAPTKENPLATTLTGGTTSTDPIATTNTSGSTVFTYAAHGMSVGDLTVVSGASAVGGVGTTTINAQHTVTAVTTNTFTVVMPNAATSTTTGGGSSVVIRIPQYVFKHESGFGDESSAIAAHVESSDVSLETGDFVQFIDRIVPDIKFRGASGGTDVVTLTVKGRDYPGDTLASLFAENCEATTSYKDVRGRARQVTLRASSSASGFGWRLGATRVRVEPDGMRT